MAHLIFQEYTKQVYDEGDYRCGGGWVTAHKTEFFCSKCHTLLGESKTIKFCSECGAQMDGTIVNRPQQTAKKVKNDWTSACKKLKTQQKRYEEGDCMYEALGKAIAHCQREIGYADDDVKRYAR